jgi:hypothetical protein
VSGTGGRPLDHRVKAAHTVAARYMADRRDNFDIYLPHGLARYNKLILGSIYLRVVAITFARWVSG